MITEQDKQDIFSDPVKWIKENRLHGKVVQNCHDGDIPSVELQIRINKPKEQVNEKEKTL